MFWEKIIHAQLLNVADDGFSYSLTENDRQLHLESIIKFIEVRMFCYLMPVIGKNMIWFYAYVEHIEIKTKTVNIINFPYNDLSQNVKIRDVPYSLKSPRNSECNLAHIYGMNKGKVFYVMCIIYKWICERK